MYVGQYMATEVITIDPEAPISRARQVMTDHRISLLPVVEEGRLLGVVSEDTVAKVAEASVGLGEKQELPWGALDLVVARAMGDEVPAVSPDTTVTEARAIASAHHLDGLPVVAATGCLVGWVASFDLLQIELEVRRCGECGTRIHVYEDPDAQGDWADALETIRRGGVKVLSRLRMLSLREGKAHWVVHLDTEDVIEFVRDELMLLDTDGITEILAQLRAEGHQVEARPSIALQRSRIVAPPRWQLKPISFSEAGFCTN